MKKAAAILFCLITLTKYSHAQVDSLKLNGAYFKHYLTDARDVVVSPTKWQRNDWAKFGLVAGTTTALLFVDEPINKYVNDHYNQKLGDFSHGFLNPLGSQYSVGLGAAFYVGGLVFKNPRAQSTGLMAVESYVISGLFVWVPKELFGRSRPDAWGVGGAFDFKGPGHGHSFPSGHTISAFSVASIFALQYKDTGWVPYVAYGMAGLAGLSRIYENRHWASDVVMGAVLGISIGHLVYHAHKKGQLTFVPTYQNGTLGVYMSFKL